MIKIEGRTIAIVFFIVIFWFAAWGLLEEAAAWLEREGGYSKVAIYGGLFALVLFYACCKPGFLVRI